MYQSFHSTPTWSIGNRYETVTKSNQKSYYPGPADYQVSKPLHRAPSFAATNGSRQVFVGKADTPGPGSYAHPSYIQEGPKRSMSARFELNTKQSPGPSDYNNDSLRVKHKQPKFSMTGKSKDFREIVKDNNLYKPSPNMYESKTIFNSSKGVNPTYQNTIRIGNSQRKSLDEYESTPGPAAYMTIDQLEKSKLQHSLINPRCSIGSTHRDTDIAKFESTPGPGAYQKQTLWEDNEAKKKGYTMRAKTANLIAKSKQKLPGPGYYDEPAVNQMRSRAPRPSSVSAQRLTFIDDSRKKASTPAPGSHDPADNPKLRSSSSFKFTRSSRKNLDDNQKTPGPCHYQHEKLKVLNTAPRFSPTKSSTNLKQFLVNRDTTPAPNLYDPNFQSIKDSSRFTEIPKSQRPGYEKARLTPGVGQYDIGRQSGGPAWKFTSDKRLAFTDSKQAKTVPGVGDYDIHGAIPNPPKYLQSSFQQKIGGASSMTSSRGYQTAR